MSVRLNDVQAALVAAFQTINGSGGYTYDLSAPGRVFVASARPEGAPDLSVWLAQGMVSASITEDVPMGLFRWEVEYDLAGFVPATADTPAARIQAANALLADLWTCLVARRTLNDGTRDLVFDIHITEMAAVDGAASDFSGCGVVVMSLVLHWNSASTA